MILYRSQIQYAQHRSAVLRFHIAEHHEPCVLFCSALVLAGQDHHRFIQNFRDALDFFQCHLRVLFQNRVDLIRFHVDITFPRAQTLQSITGSSKNKGSVTVSSFFIPLVNVISIFRVDFIPSFLRRTLVLKGRSVFFCRAQGVHGLFRVGKVFLLQRPFLGLGQPLRFQGGFVLRVVCQHFLCPAHDVAQKVLHRVHHLADGPRPACVLLRLPALELHPPLEALLAVKDAAPRVRHQLFRRFAVGQTLLCVVGKFIPDQLVNVLKALALGQILHHMLLHCLCALGVQSVIPVPVLVQRGAEHVSRAVCKKDLSGSRVHISLHPLVAFQHRLQHRIGVGRPRVQLDQLRGHLVCRAHGAFVQHPSASAHALCAQRTAQCPGLHGPGFRFALALQPRDLQRRRAAGLCQHIVRVHRKAVHALRQLHSLVKGGHVLHLSQPVQAGGRRRIPALVRNARRHVPAQRLCRALAYLPAQQLPLYAALLRALAAHFQPGRLPQGCRFRLLCKGSLTEGAVERMRDCGSFHRFPGVFHGPLLCGLRRLLGLCPRSHLRIQHLRLHGPVRVPCGHHAVPDLPAAALLLPGLLLLHGFRCLLFLLRRLRRAPLGFHLPQHLPGLCRRFGQLHPVCLGKGRAVRFVGRVRGKQLDGPACQGPAVHRFGQLLHRRVAALHCLRFRLPFQPQARPLGRAVARRRLREFVPQSSPFGRAVSALR